MTHTFKKGDKVECVDANGASYLTVGNIYEVLVVDNSWVYVTDDRGVSVYYFHTRFKPAQQLFPLANTKINVQKYAVENGISLEQAHKEIQPWLFEQGYSWNYTRSKEVHTDCGRFLYCYDCSAVTHDDSAEYFVEHANKEITLSRNVTVELTPSFVEVEEPAVEYVELGGKRYVKSELEEALSKIKAVEE